MEWWLWCRDLVPVTQLYVSVDASTKDGLKKIDRPLFRDFWDRFIGSLRALSDKVGDLLSFACITDEIRKTFIGHNLRHAASGSAHRQ